MANESEREAMPPAAPSFLADLPAGWPAGLSARWPAGLMADIVHTVLVVLCSGSAQYVL